MREADTRTVYSSFVSAVRFFYHNGPRLIVVSVLWFFCSLPLVTVGPATLAAYAAIASLREGYRIDRGYVVDTVKRHGLSATLLTGPPVVLVAISALYVQRYLAAQSTAALVLAVASTYAAAYAALVLVPTFAGLATGSDLESALRAGVRWTGRNAVGSVMLGSGTVLLFVVTAALTIAFVVVFAGLTFSFHLETVLGKPERDESQERKPSGWPAQLSDRH